MIELRGILWFLVGVGMVGCLAVEDSPPEINDSTPEIKSQVPEIRPEPVPTPPPTSVPPTPTPKPPIDEKKEDEAFRYCDIEHPEIPNPDTRIYATWQSFPVTLGAGLGRGTLRVLEDSRITKNRPYMGSHILLPPCALLDARIELLDVAGKPIQAVKLQPQVDIVVHEMAPGAIIYEAVERVQCLASCWCGNGHSFWRVDDGKLLPHRAHLVDKSPLWTRPNLGTMVLAEHVVHGCYSYSYVHRNEFGQQELFIHRTAMGGGVADERYWFDDGEWKASMKQFR